MTMYLVRVYKDESCGESWCIDVQYYCAGLYSDQKKADNRKTELETKGEIVDIVTIKTDVDLPVYEGDIANPHQSNEKDSESNIWLGGAAYYE